MHEPEQLQADRPSRSDMAENGQSFSQAFDSDASNFSRSTRLSYAYADLFPSVIWLAGLIWFAPTIAVFLPATITGIAAVLVDYVWFYRSGRREVLVDGAPAGTLFVGVWLAGWFDFLIAFNIGSYVGLMLHFGLSTRAGAVGTAVFLGWFWIFTPLLARVLSDAGFGRALITTTRRVGRKLSWGRVCVVSALYAMLYFIQLSPDWIHAVELFAVGMIAAAGMEVPLYVLGIRPGRDAWQALVLNTLVEWNYAVPILYMLLRSVGAIQ